MAQVLTSFEYLKWEPLYEREKPYEVFIPLSSFGDKKDLVSRSNLCFETRQVTVHDIRGQEHAYTLENHGFQFVKHSTTVQALTNSHQVTEIYVPEMQNFLENFLGEKDGVKTLCFDIRLRRSMDPVQFAEKTINLEDGFEPLLPATHPHIDQSETGAIRRVLRHLGDEGPELLKGRVRIINIWRPLQQVTAWPLAVCDSNSVDPSDLVACDIVRRRFVGETLFAKFHPEQKWHYLSAQNTDEIALLQIYDSRTGGQMKSCLHSSFPLVDTGVQGFRESIELRFLVFTSR